jgi:hypothetical protein
MTPDVAGVLCQDLNRPANVLVVVSLDEYRPVISPNESPKGAQCCVMLLQPLLLLLQDPLQLTFMPTFMLDDRFCRRLYDCPGPCAASASSLRRL